jgi:hypothetical protein
MTVHRIRLRGPWLLEPTSPAETPPRTVRLPARWGDLLGTQVSRVRLTRRFHCPTNLGPDDEVSLVVTNLPEGAHVSLNGASLGPQAQPAAEDGVFATPRLEPSNLLTVEFDVGATSVSDNEAWGDVALLISSP